MTGIDSAIAAATAAAANIPQEAAAGNTAVAGTQPNAVAVPLPAAGQAMGLADAMAGATIVDHWLKVSEHGLQIDGLKPVFEEIVVEIDMRDIGYTESIKFGNRKHRRRLLADLKRDWRKA